MPTIGKKKGGQGKNVRGNREAMEGEVGIIDEVYPFVKGGHCLGAIKFI